MDRLAKICEEIAARSARLRKIAILAEYLRELETDDLRRAVQFLSKGPATGEEVNLFGQKETRPLSIGSAVLREAAMAATGWDRATYSACVQESGDSGETIGLLVARAGGNDAMTLAEAEELYGRLHRMRATADRVALLKDVFTRYRPLTVKYFVKVITGGLRIGLLEKMVEEALALATGIAAEEIRGANNRAGDLAAVAAAARRGELKAIEARLFHPMEFMLAKPVDDIGEIEGPAGYLIEDKFDGIRAQVHFAPGRVAIYSRGAGELAAFPEIEEAFAGFGGEGVVDGEILGWVEGRALSFTALQQRIARKRVPAAVAASVPVAFMAYDILYRDGAMLLERPIEERRGVLASLLAGAPGILMLSQTHDAAEMEDVERLFGEARQRGNEGLLLKQRGSAYEAGRRSGAWRKLKRPFGTLDVVITAAEQGQGRRATMLSDYTFAVRDGGEYANVGKAYSGLTDAEVRELTRVLRASAVNRFGRVVTVTPAVVLEVGFDGVQRSARHKGGFALRFPRILRWRRDKKPGEADTIERVRELYQSALNLTAAREAE